MFRPSHTTTLALQITPSQIRLVEADTSRWPIKILNFALLDIISPHEDNIFQQIRGVIKRGLFETKKVNFAFFHPSIIHRLLSFPPMPAREIGAVLKREVEEIKLSPNEVVFDWKIISEVERKGNRGNEILVVIAPLPEVDRQRSLIEGSGLKCNVLTTVAIALLSSLRFVEGGEKETVAMLCLNVDNGCLVFARNGKWGLCRQFSLKGKESVLPEVKRAVHYFRQRFRGEDIDRIIISAETNEYLDRVIEALREDLGIETSVFRPAHGLDIDSLAGRKEEWEQASPCLAVVLGLLAESSMGPLIDLVPEKIKTRRKRLYITSLSLALASILATGYAGLSWHTASLKTTLRQKEAILEKAKTTEKQKDLYNRYLSFVQQAGYESVPYLRAFQFLSLIVPDEMIFYSLKAERMEGGMQVSINGEINAADAFAAQEIFNRFYLQFRSSPLFSHIELMPIDIIRTKKQRSKVNFEIRFQLKREA